MGTFSHFLGSVVRTVGQFLGGSVRISSPIRGWMTQRSRGIEIERHTDRDRQRTREIERDKKQEGESKTRDKSKRPRER